MRTYIVIGITGAEWEIEADDFERISDTGNVFFCAGGYVIAMFENSNIIGFYEVKHDS